MKTGKDNVPSNESHVLLLLAWKQEFEWLSVVTVVDAL